MFPQPALCHFLHIRRITVFLNMRRKRIRSEVRSKMSWIGYNYGQRRGFLSSPTNLLIVLNVMVFIVMLLSGDIGDCNSLVCQLMAQTGQAVYQGAYWQLFTSMFVHFGFAHIIFNLLGL